MNSNISRNQNAKKLHFINIQFPFTGTILANQRHTWNCASQQVAIFPLSSAIALVAVGCIASEERLNSRRVVFSSIWRNTQSAAFIYVSPKRKFVVPQAGDGSWTKTVDDVRFYQPINEVSCKQ